MTSCITICAIVYFLWSKCFMNCICSFCNICEITISFFFANVYDFTYVIFVCNNTQPALGYLDSIIILFPLTLWQQEDFNSVLSSKKIRALRPLKLFRTTTFCFFTHPAVVLMNFIIQWFFLNFSFFDLVFWNIYVQFFILIPNS